MGGGGGGGWPGDTSPAELLDKTTAVEKESYKTELNSYFDELLSDFNRRNPDQVNAHLETIKDALTKEKIGTIILIFGGSVKKHTYVDGISDTDILALIENTELAGGSPKDVLRYFAEKIRERLRNTEVQIGNMTVIIRFSDGNEIQVVPAISTATGYHIPKADGSDWSTVVRPDKFADKLSSVNQSKAGRVVRVIKLYKAINESFPQDLHLSGYHIESLAVEAFENYQGNLTYKDMLMHFVECASEAVLHPIKDRTGQSIHVDDYLGDDKSYDRQKVSAKLGRVAAQMRLADSEASSERWKELLES